MNTVPAAGRILHRSVVWEKLPPLIINITSEVALNPPPVSYLCAMESLQPLCDLELRGSFIPPPLSGAVHRILCGCRPPYLRLHLLDTERGGHRRHPIDAYYKERAIRKQ